MTDKDNENKRKTLSTLLTLTKRLINQNEYLSGAAVEKGLYKFYDRGQRPSAANIPRDLEYYIGKGFVKSVVIKGTVIGSERTGYRADLEKEGEIVRYLEEKLTLSVKVSKFHITNGKAPVVV